MYKNRNQKEYIIHYPKGNRSPPPKNKSPTNTIVDNDSNSDDDYRLKTNKGDSKNLILGRADNYALITSDRNVRLEQNTNRLSHFIMKTKYEDHCPHVISSRSPLRSSRNTDQQANLTSRASKYSIRNPFKRSPCRHGPDTEETNIYVKKRVVTEGTNYQRGTCNEYRCTNPEHCITYHDVYEEEAKNMECQGYKGSEINTSQNSYDFYTQVAIIIQSNWRGYLLRKRLYENLRIFYQTSNAIVMMDELIRYNQKKFFWYQLKKTIYAKKQLYIKNTLNTAKIPKIYNKNEMLSKMGIFIYKKELTESFQFVRKKQGEGNAVTSQGGYETQFEVVVNYKDKLKTRVIKQLLIMKLNKEQRNLKDAFNQFAICGLRASLKRTNSIMNDSAKRQSLKSVIVNKKNKNSQLLKKYFMKMYFNGTLKYVENSMINRVDSIKDEDKTRVLRRIINAKDKDSKEALRKYLTDYSNKTIITTLNDKIREVAKIDQRRKLNRIVIGKGKNSKQFLRDYFMKFYYAGIFKQMKCLPQKIMIEPKVESKVMPIDPKVMMKRKLKWIISTNYKNNENLLRHYFMKFYYKAKFTQLTMISSTTTSSFAPKTKQDTPKTQTPKINKTIRIQTETGVIDEVKDVSMEANTTKNKRQSVRQMFNSKRRAKTDALRRYFWKFYFGGVFCLLKRRGDITDRTTPKAKGKLADLFSNDPEIKKVSKQVLKTGNKPSELVLERQKKLKRLVQVKAKGNLAIMKNVFNVYHLKVKSLNVRDSKMKMLLIKKETDVYKMLLTYFTKFKLKIKVIRIKGILAKNNPDKKTGRKRKKKIKVDSVHTLPPTENQEKDHVMPETYEDDDYYEDDDDFLLDDNDNVIDHEEAVSPSKPSRTQAPARQEQPNEDNEEEGDDEDQIDLSTSQIRHLVMMHVKLLSIVEAKHFKLLSFYFNRLQHPNKTRDIQLETYKATLFVKIVSNWSNKHNNKILKNKFFQWKNNRNNLKRNITATLGISKLTKLIKKVTYKWYFDRFCTNYLQVLQHRQLRKIINNNEMKQVRLRNKDFRNKFYQFARKKPVFDFASSIIYMMNSFKKVEDSFELIKLMRRKRKFFIRFVRKAMWEKPLVPRFTVRNITYYLKNGQIVHLTRNDSRLRNFLWRYINPRKYYFRKYYARVLKIKEKELEAQSRKWEFEDYNPIEKKTPRKKH